MKNISLGGAMCDIGVHMIDAVVWLLGCPEILSASAAMGQNHKHELGDAVSSGILTGEISSTRKFNPDEMDVEDFAAGSIKLKNGAVINFKTAWAANLPECTEIKLVGKNAGVILPEGKVFVGDSPETLLETKKLPYDSPFAGHICIIENIKNVLCGKEAPFVTSQETKTVAMILEMLYLSASEGREVYFKEIADKA